MKNFLEEKRAANFWTFHRPVAAVDDSAIQQTSYGFSARVFFMCSQLVEPPDKSSVVQVPHGLSRGCGPHRLLLSAPPRTNASRGYNHSVVSQRRDGIFWD